MSNPAPKETRAMAQTVHPLDFHPLNVQQLSVMEASFLSPQRLNTVFSRGSVLEVYPSLAA
jgi:hypothetical protein